MKLLEVIFSIIHEMSLYLIFGFLCAGILHVFMPKQILLKYLSKNNFMSVFYAALFGVPLPLCSCGVIPTAMALKKEGASKGSVISFLIATPQTGVDSIAATYSLLGLPFAIIRPIAAFFTAIFAGNVANLFLKKEKETILDQTVKENKKQKKSFVEKIKEVLQYSFIEMMEDIGKTLLIGLLIAGLISYFVPDNFFAMFKDNTLLSMIIILVVAIPMYTCATGSIPIAIALMLKGMSPGTALVLLMAGPAANFASILVIGKVLGKKTLIVYLITIILGSIGFGLFIDYLLPTSWFVVSPIDLSQASHSSGFILKLITTIILVGCIINALVFHKGCDCDDHNCSCESESLSYKIDGMRCNKCKENVEKILMKIKSVKSVQIDLSKGIVNIYGEASDKEVEDAVSSIGFSYKGRI